MCHASDSLVWGSPLWMLHALCGAKTLEKMTTELVRDIETERFAVTIDVERAQRCNDVVLSLPALDAAEFSAQAWLDPDGLVRRVSGSWPSRSSIFPAYSDVLEYVLGCPPGCAARRAAGRALGRLVDQR